jgi:fatty-acid desaturase
MLRNKRVVFFYKYHNYIRVSVLLVGFIIFPLEYFIVLFLAPFFYGHLGFGLINALCHKNGIVSNSVIANIFTGGEGWHINHHEHGRDWRIGRTWWQWDPGAWWINLIKVDKHV